MMPKNRACYNLILSKKEGRTPKLRSGILVDAANLISQYEGGFRADDIFSITKEYEKIFKDPSCVDEVFRKNVDDMAREGKNPSLVKMSFLISQMKGENIFDWVLRIKLDKLDEPLKVFSDLLKKDKNLEGKLFPFVYKIAYNLSETRFLWFPSQEIAFLEPFGNAVFATDDFIRRVDRDFIKSGRSINIGTHLLSACVKKDPTLLKTIGQMVDLYSLHGQKVMEKAIESDPFIVDAGEIEKLIGLFRYGRLNCYCGEKAGLFCAVKHREDLALHALKYVSENRGPQLFNPYTSQKLQCFKGQPIDIEREPIDELLLIQKSTDLELIHHVVKSHPDLLEEGFSLLETMNPETHLDVAQVMVACASQEKKLVKRLQPILFKRLSERLAPAEDESIIEGFYTLDADFNAISCCIENDISALTPDQARDLVRLWGNRNGFASHRYDDLRVRTDKYMKCITSIVEQRDDLWPEIRGMAIELLSGSEDSITKGRISDLLRFVIEAKESLADKDMLLAMIPDRNSPRMNEIFRSLEQKVPNSMHSAVAEVCSRAQQEGEQADHKAKAQLDVLKVAVPNTVSKFISPTPVSAPGCGS